MAEIITTPYKQCLNYERDFDPDKRERDCQLKLMTQKLTWMPQVDNQISKRYWLRKKTIRKLEGQSTEELLYTMDTFNDLTKDMKINSTKKWSKFPKLFHHGPRKEWKKMMKAQEPELIKASLDDLNTAFAAFLKIYAPNSQSKDTLLALFKKQCRIPMSAKVQTHKNQCDLIIHYINQLQGEITQE